MTKPIFNYNPNHLSTEKPTLNLSIFEAAIDWGYEAEEAEYPEQVPYRCELTAVWDGVLLDSYIAISTHGLIYPEALTAGTGVPVIAADHTSNPPKFKRWNTSRFEVDYQTNTDTYDLANTEDNTQGFYFDCPLEFANHAELSRIAADKLETIADNLASYTVNFEYPNGMINLIGLEP